MRDTGSEALGNQVGLALLQWHVDGNYAAKNLEKSEMVVTQENLRGLSFATEYSTWVTFLDPTVVHQKNIR